MIDEHNVREMLQRRANAAPTPTVDAPKATRRARRRLFANGVIAMVAVAAIALAGLASIDEIRGGPVPADQPTPSVKPKSTRFTQRFDSPLNGLSIGYPAGWKTRAATEPWGGKIAFDAPDVDVIFDPKLREHLYLAVVSMPLGSKWDSASRQQDRPSLGLCDTGGAGGTGNGFQGNPAWFQDCYEPHGEGGHIVLFSTATRGYVIYIHVPDKPQSPQQARYARWFSEILRTVVLSPDEAVNPPESP